MVKSPIKLNFSLLFLTTVTIFCSSTIARSRSTVQDLIVLDSELGEQLLFTSQARSDYLPLSLEFETQDNLAYCGVATLVMILNALEIEAPISKDHTIPGYVSYRFFTQKNVLENESIRDVIEPELIRKQGMTLKELAGIFQTYSVKVQTFHGEDITLERFRELAIQNLKQPNNFLVVNYLRSSLGQIRSSLGQKGGGHISPVVAYNESSDRFLILDVARYRYSPVWVSSSSLWKAINTVDSTSGKTRGFLTIDP